MKWDQVYEDLARALEQHTQAIAVTTDPDKRKMMLAEVEKVCANGGDEWHGICNVLCHGVEWVWRVLWRVCVCCVGEHMSNVLGTVRVCDDAV